MAAARTADSVKTVRKGVNDDNVRWFMASWVGTWANNDTMSIVPESYEAGGAIVHTIQVWSDGAGDPGARTRTLLTQANVVPSTFVEATGALTLTNVNGGNITNPKFLIGLIDTSPL